MELSSGKFEYITEVPYSISKIEAQPDDKSQKELKEYLNKLSNENKQKLSTLSKLKKLVEDQQKQEYDRLIIIEKSDQISNLLSKVEQKESICQQEAIEQMVLQNKKENLKIVTRAMRGKLIELQKNFDRITTNHSAFNNSSFASKYALLLINKSLEEYIRHFESSKSLFKKNIQKLEKRLRTASENNSRMIRRASSVDIEHENKRKVKKEFFNQYVNCLNNFNEIALFRKSSAESLENYKQKFAMIRSFIEKEENGTGTSDFDERHIGKIIQKLKELEYRTESLNFTYQKLSEQEARLNSDLSGLKEELIKAKSYDEDPPREMDFPLSLTNLASQNSELEFFIIKNYFQFAELLYENLDRLHTNAKIISEKEIEEKLLRTLECLKDIRIGTVKRRPFQLERIVVEKLIGRREYNDNRMDILNSISLNAREIREIFIEFFGFDRNDELKALMDIVENSPIIKLFLDKDTLKLFLVKHNKNSLFNLIISLEVKCHLVLQDRLKSFANESLFFLTTLTKINRENGNQAKESPLANELFLNIPFEYKIKKSRSQSSSPYKVTEKPLKKPLDILKPEPLPSETVQITHKGVPRVYSLNSTALKRQKIMKEVLENQKKETLLRTIEKKIAKHSEKNLNLPYMKKFVLRSSGNFEKLISTSHTSRRFNNYT